MRAALLHFAVAWPNLVKLYLLDVPLPYQSGVDKCDVLCVQTNGDDFIDEVRYFSCSFFLMRAIMKENSDIVEAEKE